MVRHCHFVVAILGHCMIGYVEECWLWSILEVCFFFHGAIWAMLVVYGILTM